MKDEDHLKSHFDTLGLPPAAQSWLLDLWNLIGVFDDITDGNATGHDPRRALWSVFWEMPLNPFYRDNFSVLQPVLALQLLKWEAANAVEADGLANEKSYVWRAGFYDIVLMVCHLCGLKDVGNAVMEMYGETCAEYLEDQACQAR